jgi:hypothetical protein
MYLKAMAKCNEFLFFSALSQVELCGQEKPFINDRYVWY